MGINSAESDQPDLRTPAEVLVREIAPSFSVYLGRGIQLDSILENVDPTLNIENLNELLDIHFLLSGKKLSAQIEHRPPQLEVDVPDTLDYGVMDFMSLLRRRLRRLHTTTKRETQQFEGEVRGRINWQQTIKTRYREGNPDSLTFACELTEETVTTPENLVLWELLTTVRDAHSRTSELIDQKEASWFDLWLGDSMLCNQLEAGITDINLNSIKDTDARVSDRMIRAVSEARTPLYREAAELLSWYRRLKRHDIDDSEAKSLLGRQLFYPDPEREDYDEVPTLFELYWVFKLLEAYDNPQLRLITGATNLVATWRESGTQYELYHDWTGGDMLTFKPPVFDRENLGESEDDDRYLRRLHHLLKMQTKSTDAVFGHQRPTGPDERRPDFVLLGRNIDTKDIERVAIGEVKYTRRQSTAADGLEELLEYMIYAREQENGSENPYFTTGPDHFATSSVYGFLCVDRVPYSAVEHPSVDILSFDDRFPKPF